MACRLCGPIDDLYIVNKLLRNKCLEKEVVLQNLPLKLVAVENFDGQILHG